MIAVGKDKPGKLGRNYDRAAWFYEKSAKFYSTNQIRASKRDQLREYGPDDKVLFLGVGSGEDALMAARHGARVTCIDISQKMLDRLADRLSSEALSAELICQDAFAHKRFAHYDICCANYFLNVFRHRQMVKMLQYSARFVRRGGKYLIADVALPQGNLWERVFNLTYLKMGMATFWMMGLVPWHENYDYCAFFKRSGLQCERVSYFRFAKVGPVLFQSIVANKVA